MINFADYDKIILDGYGTLYDRNFIPFEGALKLLGLIGNKGVLFSNIGSLRGSELKDKVRMSFGFSFTQVITSLDLLCNYINENNIKKIYHYGGASARNELMKITSLTNSIKDFADAIVLTSLPQENWIKESQDLLRYINIHKDVKVILSNPDRLLPGSDVGINVGMMFDMLIKPWPSKGFKLSQIEIGKPNLTRNDLLLNTNEKLLVVGDNYKTDGGLAKEINSEFVLISKDTRLDSQNKWEFSNLNDFLSDVELH
jgi:ribonucleotide monophosphatase NagD (HAD superfamily)